MSQPPAARVTTDLACASCEYNLRSLPLDGICPECSAPIALTLDPNRLAYAYRPWLRRLKWGAILWAVAGTIGEGIWLLFYMAPRHLGLHFVIVLDLLFHLIFSAGLWLFTSPNPRDIQRPGRISLRYGLRFFAAVMIGAYFAARIALAVHGPWDSDFITSRIDHVLFPMAFFAREIALALGCLYGARLAARLPGQVLVTGFNWLTLFPLTQLLLRILRLVGLWRPRDIVTSSCVDLLYIASWAALIVVLAILCRAIKFTLRTELPAPITPQP